MPGGLRMERINEKPRPVGATAAIRDRTKPFPDGRPADPKTQCPCDVQVAPEASRKRSPAKGLRGFRPTKPQTEQTERISVAVRIARESHDLFGFSGTPGVVLLEFCRFIVFRPSSGTILLCGRGENSENEQIRR